MLSGHVHSMNRYILMEQKYNEDSLHSNVILGIAVANLSPVENKGYPKGLALWYSAHA